MQDWQKQILEKEGFKNFPPMYYTTTTNDSVHYKPNMEPVDDISVGDIIEMTRTGKEFLVESITPIGNHIEGMHDIRFIQPFSIERTFEKKFGNSQGYLKNHGRSARLVFWFGRGRCGDVPFFCLLFHCI